MAFGAIRLLLAFAAAAAAAPFRAATPNTSFVLLRFHKVASKTFSTVLSRSLQPSFYGHTTLAAYKNGGLEGLHCCGAPTASRVVFIAFFREPASRIMSAIQAYRGMMYANFAFGKVSFGRRRLQQLGGLGKRNVGVADVAPRSERAGLANEVRKAYQWLNSTACADYTVADVKRVFATFQKVHAARGARPVRQAGRLRRGLRATPRGVRSPLVFAGSRRAKRPRATGEAKVVFGRAR